MPAAPEGTGKVSARIPNAHIHGMQIVVQRLLSPYETTSDLMRHYIEQGLANDAEANPDNTELQELMTLIEQKRRAERADQFRKADAIYKGLSKSLTDSYLAHDDRWIGDSREAALHFISTTAFPSLREKLQRELDI